MMAKTAFALLLLLIVNVPGAQARQSQKAIEDLIRGLSGSPDEVALAVTSLSGLLQKPGGPDRLSLIPYERELIHILETSNDNRAVTIATLILFQIDSPEAKAATQARYRRDEAIQAQAAADREARETTLQTLAQVKAPIRPSLDPAGQLDLIYSDNLLDSDDSMLVTHYRNQNEDELFEVWRKEGDKYRQLKHVSSEGGVAFIESWKLFRFSGQTFLLVSIRYPGTGYFHSNYLYHVDRAAHSLDDVGIREAWKEFALPPDEEVVKGEVIEFGDDWIPVDFYIWKKNTCNACAIDRVHGNYVIESDGKGGWLMRPSEMKRLGL